VRLAAGDVAPRAVGLEVVAPDDDAVDLAWGLSAVVAHASGSLLSVLQPVTDAEAVTRAQVREGSRVGLD
jgi:hypothetical protein